MTILHARLGRTSPDASYARRLDLRADGDRCLAEARPASDAVVRVRYRCERPPGSVTVHSTLLTDIDQRYRTLVVVLLDRRTQRVFLGVDHPTAVIPIADDVDRAKAMARDPAPSVDRLPGLERRFVGVVDGSLSA